MTSEEIDKYCKLHDSKRCEMSGRKVRYWDHEWTIIGLNYLNDYDVLRKEVRPDGTYNIWCTCVLTGLDKDHPHFAELIDD